MFFSDASGSVPHPVLGAGIMIALHVWGAHRNLDMSISNNYYFLDELVHPANGNSGTNNAIITKGPFRSVLLVVKQPPIM